MIESFFIPPYSNTVPPFLRSTGIHGPACGPCLQSDLLEACHGLCMGEYCRPSSEHLSAHYRELACTLVQLVMAIMCLVQDGIEDMEVMFVGCLPVELDPDEQDVRYYLHWFPCSLSVSNQNIPPHL